MSTKSLLNGVVFHLLLFALFLLTIARPAQTQNCTSIDYNRPTIAAGADHTVGIREDGTIVAAGANWYGMSNISSWTGIKAIAAGRYHTVGLKEDGSVVAMGYDWYGLRYVSSWTGIKAIAAGQYYTVGIREDGTVVWGG